MGTTDYILDNALFERHNYRIGDLVRLVRGHTPLVVMSVVADGPDLYQVHAVYLSALAEIVGRTVHYSCYGKKRVAVGFVPYEHRLSKEENAVYLEYVHVINHKIYIHEASKDTKQSATSKNEIKEKELKTMNKLYKTLGKKTRFGTLLAQDSAGNQILELANGNIKAFAPCDIEEVRPYTILCREIDGAKHTRSLIAHKGSVMVGDIVVTDGEHCPHIVVSLDTNDPETAHKVIGRFNWTPLGLGDADV